MDTLIDVLDVKGAKTGACKPISSCHRLGYWHRTVHAWILNADNELLLQKRGHGDHVHENCWGLSLKSHVGVGEDCVTAILRQAKAELGLELDVADPIFLFSLRHQSIRKDNTYMNNEFNDVYLIQKNVQDEDVRPDGEHAANVRWVSIAELEAMMHEGRADMLIYEEEFKKLLKYLKRRL